MSLSSGTAVRQRSSHYNLKLQDFSKIFHPSALAVITVLFRSTQSSRVPCPTRFFWRRVERFKYFLILWDFSKKTKLQPFRIDHRRLTNIWIRLSHHDGKPDEYSSGKHSRKGDSYSKRAGSTCFEISETRKKSWRNQRKCKCRP